MCEFWKLIKPWGKSRTNNKLNAHKAPGCNRTWAALVWGNPPCSLDPILFTGLTGSDLVVVMLLVWHLHIIHVATNVTDCVNIPRKRNFIMPSIFSCFHRKSESLQSYFRRPFQRAALTSNHILCAATWVFQVWCIILMSWLQDSMSFAKMVGKVNLCESLITHCYLRE